ncbi:MAG: nitroreductase family protein [Culicoidibacterales bacterium]
MNAIFTRRSIRKYEATKIEPAKIEQVLKAAMQAPSAGNQQPWEFIVIEDEATLAQLSQMSPYSKLIQTAPLAIVVLGNQERMKYPENWEHDLGACTQNMLLQATDLGLGSVWMSTWPLQERVAHIRTMFDLGEHLNPYAVVAIGYPAGNQANKFKDRYDQTRVHYEKYELND